jgi:hypothetical protein
MDRKTIDKCTDDVEKHISGMKCPNCGKEIIARSLHKSDDGSKSVMKVRMILFSGNDTIKGVCGRCKQMIDIPYKLIKSEED